MSLDDGQDNASMAKSRLIKNSGLLGGQYSSPPNNLEYANLNSNRNLDPSTDKPPTYEMANNQSGNPPLSTTAIYEMASNQSNDPLLSTTPQRLYEPPTMQTEPQSDFRSFYQFLKPSPFCAFNISRGAISFDFGFRYFVVLLAFLGFCFCFGGWLVWKLHK